MAIQFSHDRCLNFARGQWKTKRALARLVELWNAGVKAEEIGKELGTTKNAIIGEAHRMGLPKRQSSKRAPRPPRKTSQKGDAAAGRRTLRGLPTTNNLSMAPTGERRAAHCLWPGCEEPAARLKPYCSDHCRVIYRKPPALMLEVDGSRHSL